MSAGASGAAPATVAICLRTVRRPKPSSLALVMASSRVHWSLGGVVELLAPDICRLDDWPPFLDLGLLQGPKRLRRLLLGRRHLEAEVGHAGPHHRIGHRDHGGFIEFADDILRRALRHPQAVPDG